ncbi:MAG: WxcM-like domain-containing protein, partial [Lachnospiraceae bacterium]|nr:WxcM-like domain-containing protein [Lachnospiraceae bacterium]
MPEHVEAHGRLVVVEENTDVIPFDIKRIFWVRDVLPGASRGDHATKKT